MNIARIAFSFGLISSSVAYAQQYVISTFAGGAPPTTPVAGVKASIGTPYGIAADGAGNLYFSAVGCVFKLDANGVLSRVAGNSRGGYSGDGGPATSAQIRVSGGLAMDTGGNLYIADFQRIRGLSSTGVITTVACNGSQGYSGDGGPAVSAQLSTPWGLTLDASGNIYIAETGNNRIRKVSTAGIITTVAGNGPQGYSGDNGPATNAMLFAPSGVAVDGSGSFYIADTQNFRVRKVSRIGVITTIAGTGLQGYSGDGGSATSAQLGDPTNLAVDASGNLYISDFQRIRRVSSAGVITTIAGTGSQGYSGDGGQATSARLNVPSGLAVDKDGNLYVADSGNHRIRRVSTTGIITTVAGDGSDRYFGDGGLATNAELNYPIDVAIDGGGNVLIADYFNYRIRKVSPTGMIATYAGNGIQGYSGDGGPAIGAQLAVPAGMAVDARGNLYIADSYNHRIRKVSTAGIIMTTVAGNGSQGYSGDGGPAISAQLNFPNAVAVDASGNLYIADSYNDRVRKVSPSGIITTVAGSGSGGDTGEGIPATSARLFGPRDLAIDASGNLYIAEYGNSRIRKVSIMGIITTVAGNGSQGYSGDGGPATSATLFSPSGVAVDGSGNLYIADYGNHAIRLVPPTNETVLVSSILDAASERPAPITPGKIVSIYGGGLGPSALTQFQVKNGMIGTQLAGTAVSIDGIPAPLLYTSAVQIGAIVPYGITGVAAQVTVSYQGQSSQPVSVSIARSAPSLFTLNQSGAGQAAAINSTSGTINTAANPVKIGDYISLFATGEGQTTPAGTDGKVASGFPLPAPSLKVRVTVGGLPAIVQYAGAAPNMVAGVMQVNVQIPAGVQPGGYVPVLLQVGDALATPEAVWIAVTGK